MSNKNHDKKQQEQAAAQEAAEAPEIMDVTDTEENETEVEAAELGENARLQNELDAARAEIEKEKKEYFFLCSRSRGQGCRGCASGHGDDLSEVGTLSRKPGRKGHG